MSLTLEPRNFYIKHEVEQAILGARAAGPLRVYYDTVKSTKEAIKEAIIEIDRIIPHPASYPSALSQATRDSITITLARVAALCQDNLGQAKKALRDVLFEVELKIEEHEKQVTEAAGGIWPRDQIRET